MEDEVRLGRQVFDSKFVEGVGDDLLREFRRFERERKIGLVGKRRARGGGPHGVRVVDRGKGVDRLRGRGGADAVAHAQTGKGVELREGARNDEVVEPLLHEFDPGDELRIVHVLAVGFVDEEEDVRLRGGRFFDPGVESGRGRNDARRIVRVAEVDDRETVEGFGLGLERGNVGLQGLIHEGNRNVGNACRFGVGLRDAEGGIGRDHLHLLPRLGGLVELRFERRLDRLGRAVPERHVFGLEAVVRPDVGDQLRAHGVGIAEGRRHLLLNGVLRGLREPQAVFIEVEEDRLFGRGRHFLRGGRRNGGKDGGREREAREGAGTGEEESAAIEHGEFLGSSHQWGDAVLFRRAR